MKRTVERRDPWIDRLSEYVDGELSGRESRRLEAHLPSCADCRALVDQLRQVAVRARELNRPVDTARDLWPAIERRLTPRSARRPGRFVAWGAEWLTPRLAAAAAVLLICAGAAWVWQVRSHSVQPAGPPSQATALAGGNDHQYERTATALQREARAHLTLDPHVVEVLDENVAALDSAIAVYREALSQAPADSRLRDRLASAKQKKLDVLRQAVALAGDGTN